MENYYGLEGTGVDFKLGVIFRPIEDSPFRLGLAIHTPTWYELTESYNASLSSDILAYESPYSQTLSDNLDYNYLSYDYRMITPWKFNVSAGTTLGGLVALGAEYEYADYGSSKLEDIDGYELGDQPSVEAFSKPCLRSSVLHHSTATLQPMNRITIARRMAVNTLTISPP